MAARPLSIAGIPFGRLRPVRPLAERSSGHVVWLCRCKCGNECQKPASGIVRGYITSCGCALAEYRELAPRIAAFSRRNLGIVEMWQEGVTIGQLSRHLGHRSHAWVSRMIQRYIRQMLLDANAAQLEKASPP
jgi:hypothetical protein